MFGLRVTETHDGYIGHRAIYNGRFIDILPDRGSSHGTDESIARIVAWANKERKLQPPPGKKRLIKITPWKQMMREVPNDLSTSENRAWELREGNFVLRCNPQASYGYLYIALFELKENADLFEGKPFCVTIDRGRMERRYVLNTVYDGGMTPRNEPMQCEEFRSHYGFHEEWPHQYNEPSCPTKTPNAPATGIA